jgi:hypothetical protein
LTDVESGLEGVGITPGGQVIADGGMMKVWPLGGPGLGIFFTGEDGTDWPVTRKLTENMPKRLVFTAPDLTDGRYTLKVITRYTRGGKLLKVPRTIFYPVPLIVPPPAPPTGTGEGSAERDEN